MQFVKGVASMEEGSDRERQKHRRKGKEN